MKKILSAVAFLACTASFAQNINPTVEVTNIYQGNASEVHKPQLGMAVPDSLLRFDMDFGYEVFEKPYQGAYNFKPYMLAMTPRKDAYRGRNLYLKAGAGYSLHPQLEFVYSPEQRGPFQMSVYAVNKSYFGKYHSLAAVPMDGVYTSDIIPGRSFMGHDALTKVGFEGRYNWDESILSFGVGYEGTMAGDTIFNRSLNAADFKVRFRSNRSDEKYIFYDVALNGRFASDHRKRFKDSRYPSPEEAWNNLGESLFSLSGNIGPVLDRTHNILVGFEAETVSYKNFYLGNSGRVALIPRYRMLTGKWDLDLGLRIEKLFGKDGDEAGSWFVPHQDGWFKGSLLFPEVTVTYKAAEKVSLFASANGGNYINTYSSIISRHHFINPFFNTYPIMDNSTEKIDAKVGIKGRAGSKFQFELDGGASVHEHGIMDGGFNPYYSLGVDGLLPTVSYSDYSVIYADALLDYKSGGFEFDGGFHVRRMALKDDTDPGILLPLFTCDFKALYNFNPRLYAGLRGVASSSRKGNLSKMVLNGYDGYTFVTAPVRIPGYFDLGLLAGYQFNRKLGFWLESGNLLFENIQRSPFYAEKDLWITAGITLNL